MRAILGTALGKINSIGGVRVQQIFEQPGDHLVIKCIRVVAIGSTVSIFILNIGGKAPLIPDNCVKTDIFMGEQFKDHPADFRNVIFGVEKQGCFFAFRPDGSNTGEIRIGENPHSDFREPQVQSSWVVHVQHAKREVA